MATIVAPEAGLGCRSAPIGITLRPLDELLVVENLRLNNGLTQSIFRRNARESVVVNVVCIELVDVQETSVLKICDTAVFGCCIS